MPKPLTAERLRELLSYDSETGVFLRVARTSNRIKAGDKAGTRRPDGYLKVSVDGHQFLAHRLAWFYVHGFWPQHQIDHINGDRSDNRIANLRDVPPTLNQQNQRRAHSRNASSGLLGASWDRRKAKWVAQMSCGKASKHIGYFNTKDEAAAAYLTAKRRLHEGCTI